MKKLGFRVIYYSERKEWSADKGNRPVTGAAQSHSSGFTGGLDCRQKDGKLRKPVNLSVEPAVFFRKMKKIKLILICFFLIISLTAEKKAFAAGGIFTRNFSFSNIDARDSENRPVETIFSEKIYEEPLFFRFYSRLTPPGVNRWRSKAPYSNAEMAGVLKFDIPRLIFSALAPSKNLFPRFTGRHISSFPLFLMFSLFILRVSVLNYNPRPPTDEEPRFRAPVFLE